MNMREARAIFEARGYSASNGIRQSRHSWAQVTLKSATHFADLRFGARGWRGRPLTTVLLHAHPLFEAGRKVAQTGIRANEFKDAKALSAALPGVQVRATGVACVAFLNGKMTGRVF